MSYAVAKRINEVITATNRMIREIKKADRREEEQRVFTLAAAVADKDPERAGDIIQGGWEVELEALWDDHCEELDNTRFVQFLEANKHRLEKRFADRGVVELDQWLEEEWETGEGYC